MQERRLEHGRRVGAGVGVLEGSTQGGKQAPELRSGVSVLLGATHGMAPDTLWASGMHARSVCAAVGVTQASVWESADRVSCDWEL